MFPVEFNTWDDIPDEYEETLLDDDLIKENEEPEDSKKPLYILLFLIWSITILLRTLLGGITYQYFLLLIGIAIFIYAFTIKEKDEQS